MSDPLAEALGEVAPRIPQPALRALAENERYVRTAGLRFIIPQNFKPGDVLDENTAAILNASYTTLVVNRFAAIRKVLLENPDCTYQMLDKELQAHFDNFKYNPRPVRTPGDEDGKTEEDRELIAFARPIFHKTFGGQGIERKAYEALLVEWVVGNRTMLTEQKTLADARSASLLEGLAGAFGED